MMRQCNECTLCCRLLPVPPLKKRGGERCQHQRHTGCRVYHKAGMPRECALWNCRWLVNDDTANLSRPDRSHYVIDLMPDFVEMRNDETSESTPIQVVQIWVDPRHPEAWRDPDLMAYMERRGLEGIAAIIRYGESDSFVVFPPALCGDGEFHDMRDHGKGESLKRSHTPAEILGALSSLATSPTENSNG